MEESRLVLGDAYELIKGIPDKSVDLIVTDPPYLLEGWHAGTGLFRDRDRLSGSYYEIEKNGLNKSIDMGAMLPELLRVMKSPNIYIWCNKEQIIDYLNFFVTEKGCNFEFIIWGKTNPTPFAGSHYLKDKEYCLYFWKNAKLYTSARTARTVYLTKTNTEDKKRYGHPTIKPLPIIDNLITNSSREGGDSPRPFHGVGHHMRLSQAIGQALHRLRGQ